MTDPGPRPDQGPAPRRTGPRAPAPLVVAASLGAVEGLVLVLLGVAEVVALSGTRVAMGLTTALFFVGYGAALGLCAWAVSRLRPWARSPLVLAQLIQLGLAWSFLGGGSTPLAAALAVVAALVLAGIFHPASLAALHDEP